MTFDVQRILKEVVAQYPTGTFRFIDCSPNNNNNNIYYPTTGTAPLLVFGKLGKLTQTVNCSPAMIIHTYSYAQIATKANAVSVLKAALNQYYLPRKAHPNNLNYVGLTYFDFSMPISVDIETSGNLGKTHTPEDVELLSFAMYQDGKSYIVHREDYSIAGYGAFVDRVRIICEKISKSVMHNGKFDIRVLERVTGVRIPLYFDTMLAHHVLNQAAGLHALKPLCRMYLGAPEWEKDLSKYTKGGGHYELIPAALLKKYNSWDVYWTWELWQFLEPQILADEAFSSAFMLEMAAHDLLLEVEQNGFAVDLSYAHTLDQVMKVEIQDLLNKLQIYLTHKSPTATAFNPNSWQQVQKVISGLTGQPYTGSTDEDSLLALKTGKGYALDQFIDTLLEYRKVKKAHSTYVQGVLKNERNGRVHTTFKIHGTSTGRLSSSDPNIQNIPRDKKYRSLYIG